MMCHYKHKAVVLRSDLSPVSPAVDPLYPFGQCGNQAAHVCVKLTSVRDI